jgi:hypothetical protein
MKKEVVFTQHVDHPGTRAQPFLLPAIEDARVQLKKVFLPAAFKVLTRGGGLSSKPLMVQELGKAVTRAAFYGLRTAQRLCPVDTGHLRRSLTAKQRDELSYTVGTNINYALHVEFGTKAHPIVPRKASVLRFVVKRPRVL